MVNTGRRRSLDGRPTLALLVAAGALAGCAAEHRAPPPPPVVAPVDTTAAAYLAATPALSTLAAVAKASGVSATLEGPGPFTVFAPTDAAFARLAPGTIDALLRPENKAVLVRLLTYHVVGGTLSTADLRARVASGGGTATLASVAGESLTLTLTEGHLTLTDRDGDRSYVETPDIPRSNGMVHVVNGVLVPTLD